MNHLDSLLFSLPFYAHALIALGVMSFISILAFKGKQLTVSGTITAFAMGFISMCLGGFCALSVYLFFLISAAVIGKASKKIRSIEHIQKKGGCRDYMQVLANGGPALLAIILYGYSQNMAYLMIFTACLGEAASDTWAGDIGVLSQKDPVSIVTFTKVPKGLSGGITLLGTGAGFLAAFIFSLLYMGLFDFGHWTYAAIITITAFFGCLVDSYLGATVQAHYYDEENDCLTEHESRNGKMLEKVRGSRFFDNDMVNLTSNLVTFVFAWGFSISFH